MGGLFLLFGGFGVLSFSKRVGVIFLGGLEGRGRLVGWFRGVIVVS